jgi:hypothetical protein
MIRTRLKTIKLKERDSTRYKGYSIQKVEVPYSLPPKIREEFVIFHNNVRCTEPFPTEAWARQYLGAPVP